MPSQLDPEAFKLAYFRLLPGWRNARAVQKRVAERFAKARDEEERRRAHDARKDKVRAQRAAAKAAAAREARREAEDEHERGEVHQRLDEVLDAVARGRRAKRAGAAARQQQRRQEKGVAEKIWDGVGGLGRALVEAVDL